MVYYRSMRSFRAAISRKIKIWSFSDYGPLSGAVEIAHRRTNADIEQFLFVRPGVVVVCAGRGRGAVCNMQV